MAKQYDLIVIGGGPGGYGAAVRASQLGLSTAVIEQEVVGGICLNWGCIPSKNLIHQAQLLQSADELEAIGVRLERSGLDYTRVQEKSRAVVGTLTTGVNALLKRHRVDVIKGRGRLASSSEVRIDGGDSYRARYILLATGSQPLSIAGFEFDEQQVLSSNGLLAMTTLPESLLILGAGAIGCEFAYVMNSFGVEVTLVDMADHILPGEDFESCAVLEKSFQRAGISVHTRTRGLSLSKTDGRATVTLESSDGEQSDISTDKVLVVFGRAPNTAELGLSELGIELDEGGYIKVGDYCQTNVTGIYAIGDITPSPALAHVAAKEGEIAVEHMAGLNPATKRVDTELVPSAIYCEPQVAGFGLREDRAIAEGIAVKKSVFHYPGAGKSIAISKTEGHLKLLCDPDSDEILGAHIVGHNATELLHELLLAKHAELLPEDVATMIHAHPTLSEITVEAARVIMGKPLHG